MAVEEQVMFYTTAGPMTRLDDEPALAGAPTDVAGITSAVSGLLLHVAGAEQQGVEVGARDAELQLRSASEMLGRLLELDPAPVVEPRPPERRLIGNCRHFAVLTVALLRRAGVAARARAGFADYFEPGRAVDHWIVEYPRGGRWVRVDPEPLPALDFDPLDVPIGRFLSADEAWRLCRSGGADTSLFGIEVWWGAWFIRNNVVRDLAALNQAEMLPWDHWGLMDRESALGAGPEDALVDRVARLVGADAWAAYRDLYERDDRLRVPQQCDEVDREEAAEPDA
jgi:hypothetical protein